MYHILLDGDNIQWETYVSHVKDSIEAEYGHAYRLTVFVQTNILIKYRSLRMSSLNISCSRTTNKNASDARIILEVGKLLASTIDTIVIISNDRIFDEIVDNDRVFMRGYMGYKKKTKLKKNLVINVMKSLMSGPGQEVNLADLYEEINCSSISSLRDYLNKFIPELFVSSNDMVSLLRV